MRAFDVKIINFFRGFFLIFSVWNFMILFSNMLCCWKWVSEWDTRAFTLRKFTCIHAASSEAERGEQSALAVLSLSLLLPFELVIFLIFPIHIIFFFFSSTMRKIIHFSSTHTLKSFISADQNYRHQWQWVVTIVKIFTYSNFATVISVAVFVCSHFRPFRKSCKKYYFSFHF